MPTAGNRPRSIEEWLKRARSNLARAKQPKPEEVFWEDLCFDAQQAAEKAIKAVLILQGIRPPKEHDVGKLLDRLKQSGMEPPPELAGAGKLTMYAVDARYPGPPRASEQEHRKAVELAEAVIRWAERQIAGK